jgi:hypothetical protein
LDGLRFGLGLGLTMSLDGGFDGGALQGACRTEKQKKESGVKPAALQG